MAPSPNRYRAGLAPNDVVFVVVFGRKRRRHIFISVNAVDTQPCCRIVHLV